MGLCLHAQYKYPLHIVTMRDIGYRIFGAPPHSRLSRASKCLKKKKIKKKKERKILMLNFFK